MRDENEIQDVADKASSEIARINKTIPVGGSDAWKRREKLRYVLDALNWVLDEDMEDSPI